MNDETRQNSPPGQQAPDFPGRIDYDTGLIRGPLQPFEHFISKWPSMSPEQKQRLAELLNEMSGQLSKEPEVAASTGTFIDTLRQKAQAIGKRLKMTAEVVKEAVPVAVMVTLMREIKKEGGETIPTVSTEEPHVSLPQILGSPKTWTPWTTEQYESFFQALKNAGVFSEPGIKNPPKPTEPPVSPTLPKPPLP